MPQIPMYKQQVASPPVQGMARQGRIDVSSGQAALAQGINKVADSVLKVEGWKADDFARLEAAKAETKALEALTQAEQDAKLKVNQGDVKAFDNFSDEATNIFDTEVKKAASGMSSMESKRFLARMSATKQRVTLSSQKMQIAGRGEAAQESYRQSTQLEANASYFDGSDPVFFDRIAQGDADIKADDRLSDPSVNNAARMIRKDLIGESYLRGYMDKGQHQVVLDKLDSGKFDNILSASTMMTLRNTANNKISQVRNGSLVAIQDSITSAESVIDKGAIVTTDLGGIQDELTRMGQAGGLSESQSQRVEILTKKVTHLADIQQKANDHANSPLSDQVSRIKELQQKSLTDGVSPEEMDELALLTRVTNHASKMLNSTPYAYAQSLGKIEEDIPGFNPEDHTENMTEFRRYKASIEADLGVANIPILPKEYESSFLAAYKAANPEGKTVLLSNMTKGLTPDEIGKVASQLAPKDPTLGMAMSTSRYDVRLASEMVQGSTMKPQGTVGNSIAQSFSLATRNAIKGESLRNSVEASVQAVYLQRVREKGLNETVSHKDVYESAYKDVVGDLISTSVVVAGGDTSKAITFRKSDGTLATQREFNNVVDSMTLEKLMEVHDTLMVKPDGSYFDPRAAVKSGRLVAVGENKYQVFHNTGVIPDEYGQPFVLDMGKMSELVSAPNLAGYQLSEVQPEGMR